MSQDRNNQLDGLFAWFRDGLSDEKLSTIAKISGFKYLASEDKRKTVLYMELGYFYIFFITFYLKTDLSGFSFNDRNYLLNLIQKDYFFSVDRKSWFETLNQKLKIYGRVWDSPTGGGMFGIVNILMMDLGLENKPHLPGFFATINLTNYFIEHTKLIWKKE